MSDREDRARYARTSFLIGLIVILVLLITLVVLQIIQDGREAQETRVPQVPSLFVKERELVRTWDPFDDWNRFKSETLPVYEANRRLMEEREHYLEELRRYSQEAEDMAGYVIYYRDQYEAQEEILWALMSYVEGLNV